MNEALLNALNQMSDDLGMLRRHVMPQEESGMTTHETTTRVAPYSHSSLGYAACSCGWKGPDRDLIGHAGTVLAKLDGAEHRRDAT